MSSQVPFEIAERIRSKKARYCRYLDTKQWKALEALALPDATLTFYGLDEQVYTAAGIRFAFESPKDFTRQMARLFSGASTSHQVTNSELELLSSKHVSATWAMQDRLLLKPFGGLIPVRMHGYGHYHEIWEEKEHDWFLKQLILKRTIIEINAIASFFMRLGRLTRTSPDKT